MAGSGRGSVEAARPARATDAAWFLVEGMVLDRAGNLYFTDPAQRRVLTLTAEGVVLTVAGPPELSAPTGLAIDCGGHLFIADAENHRVLRVGPEGRLLTAAGTGAAGFSGDGGPATAARLNEPWGLTVDSSGHLFIADASNHRIRKVGLDGRISTVAGVGTAGFSGDGGAASAAQLDRPIGVTADGEGNLFVVDSLNGRIRKVGRDGGIATVFDGASRGDRRAAPHSARYYPARVAVDGEGNLLIADPFQHRVWVVAGVAAPGLMVGEEDGANWPRPVAPPAVDARERHLAARRGEDEGAGHSRWAVPADTQGRPTKTLSRERGFHVRVTESNPPQAWPLQWLGSGGFQNRGFSQKDFLPPAVNQPPIGFIRESCGVAHRRTTDDRPIEGGTAAKRWSWSFRRAVRTV